MTINSVIASVLSFLKGGHVGETLASLRQNAETNYQAAINAAHAELRKAEADIAEVAEHELDVLERLLKEVQGRAQALDAANALSAQHAARMATVQRKVLA